MWLDFVLVSPVCCAGSLLLYLGHPASRSRFSPRLQLPLVLAHLERGDSLLHDLPLRNRRLKMPKVVGTEMKIRYTRVRNSSGLLTRLQVPA
ncbi:hypothetical protein BJY01DRAFT_96379 [Aspergillus pseudoustus]|uniref:Secreted protein n=1 Tax=Aspergillus pseudoustus TaxID=1810923 RepID=A0ABR4KJG7_9EURO